MTHHSDTDRSACQGVLVCSIDTTLDTYSHQYARSRQAQKIQSNLHSVVEGLAVQDPQDYIGSTPTILLHELVS